MTVRHKIFAAFALAAALGAGGCGGGDRTPAVVETDDGGFRQGQQLVRQGRDAEALTTFLKVIERRGEQSSAESHLEAGLIYLRHIKDPIEAIHHFRNYLELQPNTKQAAQVRGLIDTARREYARTLPGRPLESQITGIDQADRIKELERENEDLKSEIAGLRALAPSPSLRVSRTTIDFNEPPPATPVSPAGAPAQIRLRVAEPALEPIIMAPPKAAPVNPVAAGKKAPATAPTTRRYVIVAGDTLYRISVKLFGNGSKVDAIFEANRDVMSNKNTLPRVGTVLSIP